jgi:hypothetical protein
MAASVHCPCLLALVATLILLCAPPATAQHQRTYDPPWSDEYRANDVVGEAAEEVVTVAAKRAEAGGYTYGSTRLWLAMGCPAAPGKGVNESLVYGRGGLYDRFTAVRSVAVIFTRFQI